MKESFYHIQVNPEPWAVGPLSTGRRNGKIYPKIGRNQQLYAFQEAVREELGDVEMMPAGEYDLYFYFWRQIAEYEDTKGVKRHRNVADSTNMQKATEDALQGVLFDNDRNVKRVGSCIVEEGSDVVGQILIRITTHTGFNPDELPPLAWEMIDHITEPIWPGDL